MCFIMILNKIKITFNHFKITLKHAQQPHDSIDYSKHNTIHKIIRRNGSSIILQFRGRERDCKYLFLLSVKKKFF